MPGKLKAEIYTSVGLQKQGKNLFYRDLLHHLSHSSDQFIIAPGIKGLVMLVFTLPSFPYVFKLIKDHFPPPKDTTRAQIQEKYQLVKRHDRLGRMADTLEYSSVALPRSRIDDALLARTRKGGARRCSNTKARISSSSICTLNAGWCRSICSCKNGTDDDIDQGISEYGNAVKELMQANIFPGDMLYKNFGVTRHGRVVFYDYDEIEYLTDCNVRAVPPPRNEEDEMSGEPWYSVGPHDIFPETYGTFLLGDPARAPVVHETSRGLLRPPRCGSGTRIICSKANCPTSIRMSATSAFACAIRNVSRRSPTRPRRPCAPHEPRGARPRTAAAPANRKRNGHNRHNEHNEHKEHHATDRPAGPNHGNDRS